MKYCYLMEYLPVRYDATAHQQSVRNEVFAFKDGEVSGSIMSGLVGKILDIAGSDRKGCVVCFVPASTREKTERRYGYLSRQLYFKTGINTAMKAITKDHDSDAGHVSGKQEDPAADFSFDPYFFRGKRVILIDDIWTRGRTMEGTAARLLDLGARSVTGLVVAKTVHPR